MQLFVINLREHTDRLCQFLAGMPPSLQNKSIEVWHGVDGKKCPPPSHWTSGPGMWGCYRSHMQILEHCMQNSIERYMVFEDDAIFRDGFDDVFRTIEHDLDDVDPLWDQCYLGGQLLDHIDHPPEKMTERIYKPYQVERLHGCLFNARAYRKAYQFWNEFPFDRCVGHDTQLGKLHAAGLMRVYVPPKFVVGQRGGMKSLTNGQPMPPDTYWLDPDEILKADRISREPDTLLPDHLMLNRRPA